MRWQMIDQLVQCVPGKSATGVKSFPASTPFFTDHFPGKPTVPGAVLIESAAWTANSCIRAADPTFCPVLGVVRNAKFFQPVKPDDVYEVRVEVLSLNRESAVVSAEITTQANRIASIELLMARVTDDYALPSDELLQQWRLRQQGGKRG